MAMFHMPHGQSFGYLSTQAALTDWLVRHLRSRTLRRKLRVLHAARLEQSSWRIERRWGWVEGFGRCIVRRHHPAKKSPPISRKQGLLRLLSSSNPTASLTREDLL